MAREYAIPSTSTFIQDFGLNVTPPAAVGNRRVVILGTAEDGPMYEPVLVDKPEDAELVWGRSTQGDLVRGIFECWGAQTGFPNVVGVRIGTGTKAHLNIVESDGDGIDEEQPDEDGLVSLRLEARYPGAIYNNITVRYDDRRNVSIFNPKTGVSSTFRVNPTNPNDTSADARNVLELASVINADRNLNTVLRAEAKDILTDYEVKVDRDTDGIQVTDNSITVDLKKLVQVSGVFADDSNAFLIPEPILPYDPEDTGGGKKKIKTITNNILEIEKVESVSVSQWEKLEFDGNITNLQYNPLDGKGTSRWDTIQALKDYDGDNLHMFDPSGNIVSEFIYHLDNVLINEIPTTYSGVNDTNTFTIDTPLPFDDSELPSNAEIAKDYIEDPLNINYANYADNWTEAVCLSGVDVDNEENRPSGIIRVFVSDQVNPNANWVELPYHTVSGVYFSGYDKDTGVASFSIGASGYLSNQSSFEDVTINGVKFTNLSVLVDNIGAIRKDKFIRVTGNTIKGFLNEVQTLPSLEAVTVNHPTSYFVRGQELLLNAPPAFPMIVNYGTRIEYELGTNFSVNDAVRGVFSFNNPELMPGPGGGPLLSGVTSSIRFRYKYLPNFPRITSAVQSMTNGTNGTNLTPKHRETELKKAYDVLKDFEATLWVPMNAFIDDTKEDWNPLTGIKEKINTSYTTDMVDFLEELSINSIQPHAVLGTTMLEDGTISERDKWVKNLTEFDATDPLRAANVMINIQTKFISVAAFEAIFANIGRGRPYSANGQAAYAGMLASLPYDISPTNKQIQNVSATRTQFSIRQLEALNTMRYVTMRTRRGQNPVIVNDVTAAPYGSDFVSWSTYSITAEASDRVKAIAEAYLGRPNSVEVRNAMDQDISNELQAMSGIQAYNFTISSTIEQQVLGVVEIELIIVPIFTMKKIRTTVKLRKSLPTESS